MFYNQGLNRQVEVEDINGKLMPAITIFSMAINYMRKHLMDALKKEVSDMIKQSDVMFVLTVPAIWNDASKQFMREVAIAVSYSDLATFNLIPLIERRVWHSHR